MTETTDTSSASEISTDTTNNEEVEDVLNEANKLIENAEQVVNNETTREDSTETIMDSSVIKDIDSKGGNIEETSSEMEIENAQ